MDPVKLMRGEQEALRDLFDSDADVRSRLSRYLDVEERVLFDFCARYLRDDDQLARARDQQADLERLLNGNGSDAEELASAFERHVGHVNGRLLAPLVTHVDATRYEDLGDALEEARSSWDEHDQSPHVRVGVADGELGGPDEPRARSATEPPGAYLGDETWPATPEPNEPA